MDILNSLYTSVFGMSVVFVALISLIFLINLQSFVASKIVNRKSTRNIPEKAMGQVIALSATGKAANVPESPKVLSDPQELKLTGVDEKTAAIIMAIVCDETGISPNELYFKSIRLMEESAPGMNEGE